ncbi:HalOD1 output domain-containing protein [Halopiger goleimassiliensis]|uniref:HalOD1 output domain-containing protein n=1 Tax=Halopiger goleimassiliensis TaxID=1293048 RepID=UPI000677EFD5|nr:HalOD1 output domain-containing protein [Halopiger goleimassiliensis]
MNSSITDSTTDPDGISMAVVDAVAARRSVDPVELPPLYEWIDPEAIDALFGSSTTEEGRRLEFVYDGHGITIDDTSTLRILVDGTPVSERADPLEVDEL